VVARHNPEILNGWQVLFFPNFCRGVYSYKKLNYSPLPQVIVVQKIFFFYSLVFEFSEKEYTPLDF